MRIIKNVALFIVCLFVVTPLLSLLSTRLAHASGFPLATPNFTASNIVFDTSGNLTSFTSDNASMQGMNSGHTYGHAWYMNDDNTYSYHSNDFSCDNAIHCSGDLQFDQNFKGTQTQIEVSDSSVCYWSQVMNVSVLNGRPIVGTVTVSPNPVQ